MAALPGAHVYLREAGVGALLFAHVGACWLLAPRGVPARGSRRCWFLPLLMPSREPIADRAFEAVFIDVGQGLSVLVRTEHTRCFTTRGARYPSEFDLGRAAVLPTLHAIGVRTLDRLIVSHGDNDHAGGMRAVAREFRTPTRVAANPSAATFRCARVPQAKRGTGTASSFASCRRRLIGRFERPRTATTTARACCLSRARAGRLLLTGDISSRIEPAIADAMPVADTPLVLGVPHHGSHLSSSAEFIDALEPDLAIISAGWRSRYGHPHPEVVARYRDAGVDIANTAERGALTIEIPADAKPLAAAERERRRRYWRESGTSPSH